MDYGMIKNISIEIPGSAV